MCTMDIYIYIYMYINVHTYVHIRILYYYFLQSNENFCIDTHHLASLIDDKTTAILVSNPSIPMGTLHSEEDLKRVLAVAEEHFIPIISDESGSPMCA